MSSASRSGAFDVAVIGLGAMGSAALFHLARRGVSAVGVERFTPGHDRGSSHGEITGDPARLFRAPLLCAAGSPRLRELARARKAERRDGADHHRHPRSRKARQRHGGRLARGLPPARPRFRIARCGRGEAALSGLRPSGGLHCGLAAGRRVAAAGPWQRRCICGWPRRRAPASWPNERAVAIEPLDRGIRIVLEDRTIEAAAVIVAAGRGLASWCPS